MLILRNKNTGSEVASIVDDKLTIKDHTLRNKLEGSGIQIPAMQQAAFDGKDRILLADPLAAKAFKEVYSRFQMNTGAYGWYKN